MADHLIVGSVAGFYHGRISDRAPADLDLICTYKGFENFINYNYKNYNALKQCYPIHGGKKMFALVEWTGRWRWEERFDRSKKNFIIEAEIAWDEDSSAAEILRNAPESSYYASLVDLYWLKMSHRYLKNSPFFLKTMEDIKTIRKMYTAATGKDINDTQVPWFAQREKETYTYNHPNLNQSKKNFFDNSTGLYVYDHDSLHECVKVFDRPAYEFYKSDANEVYTSSDLFFQNEEFVRLAGVYEEACVLALERCLIPFDFKTSKEDAFKMALQKVCTSITSGWFREYAWNNYDEVIEFSKAHDYVEKFKKGLESGLVKPFVS